MADRIHFPRNLGISSSSSFLIIFPVVSFSSYTFQLPRSDPRKVHTAESSHTIIQHLDSALLVSIRDSFFIFCCFVPFTYSRVVVFSLSVMMRICKCFLPSSLTAAAHKAHLYEFNSRRDTFAIYSRYICR